MDARELLKTTMEELKKEEQIKVNGGYGCTSRPKPSKPGIGAGCTRR